MSRHISPSTNRSYGVLQVTRVWEASPPTLYRRRRCDELNRTGYPGGAPGGGVPCYVEGVNSALQAAPWRLSDRRCQSPR
jgi:hypothetical protein